MPGARSRDGTHANDEANPRLQPGPRVGEVLKEVYERQLDGTITNLDEALAAASEIVKSG